jgi:hypothetical protein
VEKRHGISNLTILVNTCWLLIKFNLSNGQLKYSGNEYRVSSPNFVCCCPTHAEDEIPPLQSQLNLNEMLISSYTTATNTTSSSISAVSSIQEGRGRSPSLGSDASEESTVPAWGQGFSGEDNTIKAELTKAKREIESLRKLLAEKA